MTPKKTDGHIARSPMKYALYFVLNVDLERMADQRLHRQSSDWVVWSLRGDEIIQRFPSLNPALPRLSQALWGVANPFAGL